MWQSWGSTTPLLIRWILYVGTISGPAFLTNLMIGRNHAGARAGNCILWVGYHGGRRSIPRLPLVSYFVCGTSLLYHHWVCQLFRRINRTTLEDLSPFLLLRLIPNLTNPHDPFPTPEHRLNYDQRRVIKRAHRQIQLHNVGWRKNWGQVFGWERRRGWVYRLLLGGAGYVTGFQCHLDGTRLTIYKNHRKGDGRSFPRNPRADDMLAKLVDDLHNVDKDL